jgi:hypothetical protein
MPPPVNPSQRLRSIANLHHPGSRPSSRQNELSSLIAEANYDGVFKQVDFAFGPGESGLHLR